MELTGGYRSARGDNVVVQGNLDPCSLFLPQDKIQERAREILTGAGAAQGHIFNLGHGVLPTTPVENVVALVDMVHRLSRK
jgi:uroporphyrinogen decarboxylase